MIKWKTFSQPPRQGTSHKKRSNSPCQDMYAIKENDEIIVATLSDGLGQLKYSQFAATAVTTNLSTYLLNYNYKYLDEYKFKYDILNESRKAINEFSYSQNLELDEMDCTLLFIILFKKKCKFIYGQLGDGAIIAVNSNSGLLMNEFEECSKTSSNLTKTVLSKDAINYFNIKICTTNKLVGFFLTTDGLENEIYSRACKVKKNIEWYFNLISNNTQDICTDDIKKRWDALTAEERFGFTDDMSLVAIVKPNIKIELPNDATWLCACMHRNCLESSRCENCGTDFLKIYKGFNFKELGGKMNFFTSLNQSPEEEINIVVNKISYQYNYINSSLNEKNKTSLGHQSINGIKNKKTCDTTNKKKKKFVKYNSILNKIKFKDNIKKIIGSINIWLFIILLICDLTFNLFLDTSLKRLNAKISKIENMVNMDFHFPNGYNYYYFDNGDIYCGQLNNGLPNGIGIVYSSDVLIIGSFHNGLKNGEFKFLYVDGTFETRIYNMDKLVSKNTTLLD